MPASPAEREGVRGELRAERAPPELIDSHAHLDAQDYGADLDAVIERARAAGVRRVMLIGLWRAAGDFGQALGLASGRPDYFSATIGVHPHDAAKIPETDWAEIERLSKDPRILAIGESGLDFHYDHSPRPVQVAAFRRSIVIARTAKKPVVVHVREADLACAEVIAAEGRTEEGGVIHCFTGNWERAKAYLDLGFHLSVAGVVTFKSAEDLRDAVRKIPIDRLLIETDCPYLAPIPYRGKRNEPAYIVKTAELIAELQGISIEELGRRTSENARRVFRLPAS
jgi:TatD DNase family protein